MLQADARANSRSRGSPSRSCHAGAGHRRQYGDLQWCAVCCCAPPAPGRGPTVYRHSINGPGGENIRFSVPEILDFRTSAKSLAGIAEYSGLILTLQGERDAVRVNLGLVTGNYFSVMGLSTILGRALTDADDGTGVPPVIVLTRDYWLKRFGGDSSIVGRQLRIDGRAVEVVGVLQEAPTFPERMDALMNMVISEHHTSAMMVHGRSHRMTDMIARLAGGDRRAGAQR
jgi:hypothetical protein